MRRDSQTGICSPPGLTHPCSPHLLQDGSPWLETNWVSLREEALCPASWAQSSVDCSGEPEG